MARPRILLTNDDGVAAPGLRAAYEALREVGSVTVVAPSTQRSGASHTITLETPLRAYPLDDLPGFRVDFTPVDCVKLALLELLPEPPDLVVSGINHGTNAGQLVHYSGTVGAAKEAVLNGHAALAVSLCQYRDADFAAAGRVTALLARRLLERPLGPGRLLNVNVPPGPFEDFQGFRWCRQGLASLDERYERREDPRRQAYYWLTGLGPFRTQDPSDDLSAVNAGCVSLTPLRVDWTDEELFASRADLAEGLADPA